MRSSVKNIKLNTVDDLFSTEESRQDANREKVIEIPLVELYPFKHHPFKVVDDERMLDTADSIREYGVLVPAIARPREEGGYELVAGHRRKRGCELAGLSTMPVIVRNLDDDAATIIMVRSGHAQYHNASQVFPQILHPAENGASNPQTAGKLEPQTTTGDRQMKKTQFHSKRSEQSVVFDSPAQYHAVSLSGGKDSTCMLLMMIESLDLFFYLFS